MTAAPLLSLGVDPARGGSGRAQEDRGLGVSAEKLGDSFRLTYANQ